MHCVVCSDRMAARPRVCDSCRSWLPRVVGDVRILAEQLATPEPQVRDVRVTPVRDPDHPTHALRDRTGRLVLRWRDPIAHASPAGPVPGLNPQPRVSASHEAPVPINVGAVDLGLRARPSTYAPGTEASVATALDVWVESWRLERGAGEQHPGLTAHVMGRWLGDRIEWACDSYPAVPLFAEQMRLYRAALRRALGLTDRPEYKAGVACPKCAQRALWRRNGQEWTECASCGCMLSPDEYEAQVSSLHARSTRGTF